MAPKKVVHYERRIVWLVDCPCGVHTMVRFRKPTKTDFWGPDVLDAHPCDDGCDREGFIAVRKKKLRSAALRKGEK